MERQTVEMLIDMAAAARHNARVPLSGFHVGAALLTKNADVITGCNAEQGNMYESICAERCALTKAISLGYREFQAIAVVSDAEYPLAPCGLCRQALIDFGTELPVIMSNPQKDRVLIMTTGELMPAYDLASSELTKALDTWFDGKADDE